eukprot:m.373556 g.373556  ORF g.373556 m.373556 type:complete len:56 (-) comp68464_c0_seq1:326-493(-)
MLTGGNNALSTHLTIKLKQDAKALFAASRSAAPRSAVCCWFNCRLDHACDYGMPS